MANLFIGGVFQALNASGICPFAELETYAAGTLTPLATYTDAGGLSANATTVICNAAGQANVWLGVTAYRFRLYTATSLGRVLIYDVDNFAGSLSSSQQYGTPYVDAFTGTGAQTTFTLSANPNLQKNLQVSVAGLTLRNGVDYTWSATSPLSLVFTTAPANAAAIEAYYTTTLPIGTSDASTVTWSPSGTGAVARTVQSKLRDQYSVYDFACVGDGVTDDYTNMARADVAAALAGAVLFVPRGTFKLGTSYAFTAPVVMMGGVFTGAGTVSFLAGFTSPPYYCFDCLVGSIRGESICAEWFGARQSTATPTSLTQDISTKAWNAWPSWVTNATFGTDPGHDYGNGAYLAANKPFLNADTWDHIAIQRALWSVGEITSGGRTEVRLFGATYYLNKAVRYTGDMGMNVRGAGRTKTLLTSNSWAAHGAVTVDVGTARALIHFYRSGPEPLIIEGVGMTGPSGYTYGGSPPIYLVTHIGANGVIHKNQWATTGDAGWYFGTSCSDCTVEDVHTEYLRRSVYGYDALSWVTVRIGAFWQSGVGAQAIDVLRYAYVKACEFIGYTLEPIAVGAGSHLSGVSILQATTGYASNVDGQVIRRRIRVPISGSTTVITLTMGANSAIRTRMVVGGVVQGLGTVGLERTLNIYRAGAAPVAAGSAATTWGDATAIAKITESVATTATSVSLTIANSGTVAQVYDANVTIWIEGDDVILQGLV